MISEEKAIHILHLMLDGIEKEGLVTFPRKEEAVREARTVTLQFISHINSAGESARKRIKSQKNPPPEFSPQWDNLYRKYYEEELRKMGG